MIHEVRFWDKDTPLDYEEFKLVFGSLFETNADIKRKFKDLNEIFVDLVNLFIFISLKKKKVH